MKAAILVLCLLASFASPAVLAEPTSFGAEEVAAPAAPVAPDDIKGMLANCDGQLRACEASSELCEKDKTGIGFLGAAYLALWIILMAFFFMVRGRQRKIVAEMNELRARLAKAQGGL